jgi:hypothetical protein
MRRGDGKTNLHFDFDDVELARLERVKGRLNAASRIEVVRRALRLLDYMTLSEEVELRFPDGRKKTIVFF